jgi:hypothetical protein
MTMTLYWMTLSVTQATLPPAQPSLHPHPPALLQRYPRHLRRHHPPQLAHHRRLQHHILSYLDPLEVLCDLARDHNVSTSHFCTTDLWHGLLWRPIFESQNAEDNEVDHTLLSLNWKPIDEYDYEARTYEEDEADFAFLEDNDYDGRHYYNAYSYTYAYHRGTHLWHSENGMLDAIAEDDGDGDAHISSSDAEMLDVILEDDEDGDASLSSSDENESLSSSTGSISFSASSSCTSLELDVASDCEATSKMDYSFGVPLTRYPFRHGTYSRLLSFVARLG